MKWDNYNKIRQSKNTYKSRPDKGELMEASSIE